MHFLYRIRTQTTPRALPRAHGAREVPQPNGGARKVPQNEPLHQQQADQDAEPEHKLQLGLSDYPLRLLARLLDRAHREASAAGAGRQRAIPSRR